MSAVAFLRRHPFLTTQYAGLAAGAAALAWYGQTLGALVWAGSLAGIIALDVLRARTGTQLGRRTARARLALVWARAWRDHVVSLSDRRMP